MKPKFLILAFLMTSIMPVIAQTYYPLVDTNKVWSVLIVEYTEPPVFDSTQKTQFLKFGTDTTINSLNYKKIFKTFNENMTNWYQSGYIREDSVGKVYHLNYENYYEEYLLYDFNANVGDTINYFEPYVVDSIDSIFLSNHFRKRIFIHSIISDFKDIWIEGIGSNFGVIYGMSEGIVHIRFELLCFYENDTLYYQNNYYNDCYIVTDISKSTISESNEITIYPNPADNHISFEIVNPKEKMVFELYNSMGEMKNSYPINSEKSQITLNYSYKNGLYLYVIKSNESIIKTGKIVIE